VRPLYLLQVDLQGRDLQGRDLAHAVLVGGNRACVNLTGADPGLFLRDARFFFNKKKKKNIPNKTFPGMGNLTRQ
jgi:hypothetical protein